MQYGSELANALTDYHIRNGGISRYQKFRYFFSEILGQSEGDGRIEDLLALFSQSVEEALLVCDIALGLDKLRLRTKESKWFVVSGGDQLELRKIFAMRGLDNYFDGGIFGSPKPKGDILLREVSRQNIVAPAVYIGDSKYDYRVSREAGIDFIFVSQWTEVVDWEYFVESENINYVNSILDL